MALDARRTGTAPDEPWRILVLPEPEQISLVIRIDAHGVHEIGLYKTEDAIDILEAWLPAGPLVAPDPKVDAHGVLDGSDRSALITVTRYRTQGSEEIADASTDLVLAHDDYGLHAFNRDPVDRATLVPSDSSADVHDTLVALLQ